MELGNRIDPVGLAIGKTNASANINQNYVPYNQAVAALCEFPIIQTTYTNSFFLPSLGRGQLGLVYPCKFGTWCASIDYYGFSEYGEISAGIAFAKWFKPYFSIGLELDYIGIFLSKDDGVASTAIVQLGMIVFPTNSLNISVHAYNLSFSPVHCTNLKIRIPSIFKIGVSYKFEKNILLKFELSKELSSPILIGGGIEYEPIKFVTIRAGFCGQKNLVSTIGIGLNYKSFGCDLGISYDTKLGISSAFGLYYRLKKR